MGKTFVRWRMYFNRHETSFINKILFTFEPVDHETFPSSKEPNLSLIIRARISRSPSTKLGVESAASAAATLLQFSSLQRPKIGGLGEEK